MIRNSKGVTEIALLVYVIVGLALLFVPNPVSNAVGLGIKPNKTTYSEKLVPVKVNGREVIFKSVTDERDIQQHPTFLDWLRSLPGLVIILMLLGIVFPPVSLWLANIYKRLKGDTKKIVVGVDQALDKIQDPVVKDVFLGEMDKVQDTSTKKLVDEIQGK